MKQMLDALIYPPHVLSMTVIAVCSNTTDLWHSIGHRITADQSNVLRKTRLEQFSIDYI